jgi:hypothetical protein
MHTKVPPQIRREENYQMFIAAAKCRGEDPNCPIGYSLGYE